MHQIINGDCIEELKKMSENSVDSIVTDPPYELGFMGKSWDSTGIANNVEMWKECLRVLKPGGYLLSFGGTRTYHRMACAIEDAGFEVRDMIEWVYGSGFPKSRNIGLDVDKRNGVTKNRGKAFVVAGQSGQKDKDTGGDLVPGSNTMGAYVAQNEWSGWGTALKPAHEPICMARKPLAEKTVASNVLKYGTGGINIDESRVEANDKAKFPEGVVSDTENNYGNGKGMYDDRPRQADSNPTGRFPANLIHDNSEEVRECFPETGGGKYKAPNARVRNNGLGLGTTDNRDGSSNAPDNYGDSGNASRFFKSIIYQAKASKSERNRGCEELEDRLKLTQMRGANGTGEKNFEGGFQDVVMKNSHPTVKPIALMEYLIKVVTLAGGTVLDPFMGSGSTGVASVKNGYLFIGIEMEKDYCEIASKRIESVNMV